MKTIYIKRFDLFKNINMVLCNNITKVGNDFVEDNYRMFYKECDECKGEGFILDNCSECGSCDQEHECHECEGEGRHECDPLQYFLCNLSDSDKKYIKSYGVTVGYSNTLNLDVIAMYDYGTGWGEFSHSKEVEDDYILGALETNERMTHY